LTTALRLPPQPARPEPQLEETFDRLVEEGEDRLARPLLALISTGLLGGIDVGMGVLGYLLVFAATHNPLLSGLAFSIGFVALLLARSELFTENFLVPVITVVAGRSGLVALSRLWLVTLVTNLVGGWVITALIVTGLPDLKPAARTSGAHYAELGQGLRSFCLAVLAGAAITLMTRMQHATDNFGVQIVPAILFGFLLAGGGLFHSVLDSLMMFAGLWSGASYGYADWLAAFGWAVLGNLIGGLVLVTALRLLRVPHRVVEERHSDEGG
jgi:formate/nitrite transporter FocA (FNT family)